MTSNFSEYDVYEDFGLYIESGYPVYTGLYDGMENVYPSPGIMDYPNNPLAGWGNAYGHAMGTSNPGGVGLVNQANDLLGNGNFISGIFAAPDTEYLLQASSQGSIDNMLSGMGIGGYGTYPDYSSLIQDSYYYYDQGVNTYEQFDPSDAYINDDAYYYANMGYANDVIGWADSF